MATIVPVNSIIYGQYWKFSSLRINGLNEFNYLYHSVYQFCYVQRKATGVLLKTVSQIKNLNQSHPYGGSFSDGIGHIFLIAKLFSVICSSVHPDQYNGPYSNILKFMSIQVKYRFLLSSDLKKKVSQAILCGSMCVSVFLCVIFLSNA